MQTKLQNHRWVILVAATLAQIIGTFPAIWAVYQPYVVTEYGYSSNAATMVMSNCVVAFGIFSIIGGRIQDKFSPRFAAMVGTLSIGFSFFNAWWIPTGNPLFMYVGFCLFFGGGCGFFIQAAVVTMQKYFPDRAGFAMGLSSACAAIYVVIMTYISEGMVSRLGVRNTMLTVGIISLVLGLGCTMLMIAPTLEYMQEMRSRVSSKKSAVGSNPDFTPSEMLRTPQFYLLAVGFMLALPTFQLINPQLVSLCMERGLSKQVALSATAFASAATAVGRVLVPSISDRIGRKRTMAAMWAATTLFAIAFMKAEGMLIVVSWMALSFVYSGGSIILTPFTTDLFGFANAGSNCGLINIANTIGAMLGSVLLTAFTPLLGSNTVYIVGIVTVALGLCCILLIDTNTAKYKKTPAAVQEA